MTMLRPEWIGEDTLLHAVELRDDVAVVVYEYFFGQFRVQLWTARDGDTWPSIEPPEC
jgi:hypothetical protein